MVVDTLESTAEQGLRYAVRDWWVEGDMARIRWAMDHAGVFPAAPARFLTKLRTEFSAELPALETAESLLRIHGHEDAAGELLRLAEECCYGTPKAWTEVVERLRLPALADQLRQVGVDVTEGRFKSQAAVFSVIEGFRDLTGTAEKSRFQRLDEIGHLPKVEEPAYAVETLLFDRTFALVAGDPKSRKTILCEQIALGTLTGYPVLGSYQVLRQGPVVFVQADMGESYFLYSLQELAKGTGCVGKFQHPFFYECTTSLDLSSAAERDRLKAELKGMAPALVVADPLRDLHSADENLSNELKPVLDFFLWVRDELGSTVCVIDHLIKPPGRDGKRQGPAGYHVRGSSAKFGRADSILMVEDVKDGISRVTMNHRYAKGEAPIYFRIADQDETGKGFSLIECPSPCEEGTKDEDLRDSAYARVLEFLMKGAGWYSQNDIARGAKVKREKVRDAILELIRLDRIEHDGEEYRRRKWHLKVGVSGVSGVSGKQAETPSSVGVSRGCFLRRKQPTGGNTPDTPMTWTAPETELEMTYDISDPPRNGCRQPGEDDT